MGESETITVLHVEDDRAFADLCADMLERQNDVFRVRTASDPEEGLAALETGDIDCVVSDFDMPVMTGIEFLKTVRADDSDLPFLLFTGKGSEEVASQAITAGVTDYLQKNGRSEKYAILAHRITNSVESHRREQAAERYHRQLAAVMDNSRDAILTVDADSRIRFANPAVETHFGYTPEELQGERLTVLMPERLRDRHRQGLERYLRTGERSVDWAHVEFTGLHKDGHELPLAISYADYTQDGEHRFIGVLREQPR